MLLSGTVRRETGDYPGTAGDLEQVKQKLRELGWKKVFDETKRFRLPRFRVRAYRRGAQRKHGDSTVSGDGRKRGQFLLWIADSSAWRVK